MTSPASAIALATPSGPRLLDVTTSKSAARTARGGFGVAVRDDQHGRLRQCHRAPRDARCDQPPIMDTLALAFAYP